MLTSREMEEKETLSIYFKDALSTTYGYLYFKTKTNLSLDV